MLLDEIVEIATDEKQPIAVLLRKCVIKHGAGNPI